MRYKLIFAILFSWNIAFASDNDEEGSMIYVKKSENEDYQRILDKLLSCG